MRWRGYQAAASLSIIHHARLFRQQAPGGMQGIMSSAPLHGSPDRPCLDSLYIATQESASWGSNHPQRARSRQRSTCSAPRGAYVRSTYGRVQTSRMASRSIASSQRLGRPAIRVQTAPVCYTCHGASRFIPRGAGFPLCPARKKAPHAPARGHGAPRASLAGLSPPGSSDPVPSGPSLSSGHSAGCPGQRTCAPRTACCTPPSCSSTPG